MTIRRLEPPKLKPKRGQDALTNHPTVNLSRQREIADWRAEAKHGVETTLALRR